MSATALDETARQSLLRRARGAIAAAIGAAGDAAGAAAAASNESSIPSFRAGAFVTLHLGGRLRGCVGYVEADLLIADCVERCAVSAATADPRFPPLDPSELESARLEISVLGPIELVTDITQIEIGRHGLIAELGGLRGLLLPQVAGEWHWDRETFAAHTCTKAGLPADAWRHGASLYRFEADVFAEGFTLAGPGV